MAELQQKLELAQRQRGFLAQQQEAAALAAARNSRQEPGSQAQGMAVL